MPPFTLPTTTKTIIQVDIAGYHGLGHFIQKCYDLEEKWELATAYREDYQLFEITPAHEYDTEYALEVLMANQGSELADLRCILAKMCEDGFLPYGNYLISW